MTKKIYQQALEAGSIIESFEIIEVLGVGGFGITYKAVDNDLHHEVAIKEYLPSEFAWRLEGKTVVPKFSDVTEEYEYGLERFLDEGRTLARFKHPNIVRVVRFLRANGTGYLVMDYEYGQTFNEYLIVNPQPDEETLLMVMISVLKGLGHIHSNGFLHRDIKPGNIYMRDEGEALLIDFGAARFLVGEHSHSMTGIVTSGYAPYEQYSTRAKQGPACDIYALGASLYRALSGAPPVESPDRVTSIQEDQQDPLLSALQLGVNYSERFLKTIDWMLQPFPKDRPQSAEEVLHYLFPEESEIPVNQSRNKNKQAPAKVAEQSDVEPGAAPTVSEVSEQAHSGNTPTVLQSSTSISSFKELDGVGKRSNSFFTRPATLIGIFSFAILLIFILVKLMGSDAEDSGQSGSMQLQSTSSKQGGNSSQNTKKTTTVGSLSIVTKPAGAKVYIDGKLVGETPFSSNSIATGAHIIELLKIKYTIYKTKINITKNKSSSLNLILKTNLQLSMTITTSPADANIKFINSKLVYKPGMKLPTGYYDLGISAPGFKTRRMRFPLVTTKHSQLLSLNFNVTLHSENFIKKYNMRQYGRITALRYVSRFKYLLVSTIYGALYIIEIDPAISAVSSRHKNSSATSTGVAIKPYDLDSPSYNPLAYKLIAKFSSYQGKVFALSRNKSRIYIGTREGEVLLYDMVKKKRLRVYGKKSSDLVRAIAVSRDERKMAVVVGTKLKVWDIRRNRLILSGDIGAKVSQVIFSKDKRSLLVYRWYKPYFDRVSLADNNYIAIQRFNGNDKSLNNMVLSSDRKMIFAEGKNYNIKAWNLQTTNIVRSYKGHSDSVNYIALRAGKLYSAGRDQTLRVWDVNTTKIIAVLQGHRTILGAVAVAPDGTIFSGDDKGQVFLWKLK